MPAHMQTTIDLPDALLQEAKRVAAEEATTLRALIEAGLRTELDRRRSATPSCLRDGSFGDGGMREPFASQGWPAIRDAIYEGRGPYEAARKALKIEQGLQAMAEWEREEGPFTDEERAEGERIFDDLLRRTGRRP